MAAWVREKNHFAIIKEEFTSDSSFCLETSRTWPIHENVLEILNARLRARGSQGEDTRSTHTNRTELKPSEADIQKPIFHRKNPFSVKGKQGSFLTKATGFLIK